MESSRLFSPLRIGNAMLKHRVAMAPLTRFRNSDDHVPTANVVTYYDQRSRVPGTMLITEATAVAAETAGYPNIPGLYNDDQVANWRKVTDAVHANGSFIFAQLWSLGRVAVPGIIESKGFKVMAPSPIPAEEGGAAPLEMQEEDIQRFIEYYAAAAKNAMAAGFDGVEIHGANGYLLDQFTQDVSNQRTDKWGGSVENRARFGLEVTKAVVAAIGAEHVGYRISPRNGFQAMGMKDPVPQFSYLAHELRKLNIAYLHTFVGGSNENAGGELKDYDFVLKAWGSTDGHPLLLCGGMNSESATEALDKVYPDQDIVAVFGRHFISTPDLPFRMKTGLPMNPYDRSTFYASTVKGYTDYEFSKEFLASQA